MPSMGASLVLPWTNRAVCDCPVFQTLMLANQFLTKEFQSLFAFNVWNNKEGTHRDSQYRQTDRHWDRQAVQHWTGRSIKTAEEFMYSCSIWPKMTKLMDFLLFLFILHWCPLSSLEIYYSGSLLLISSLLCSPKWAFFLFSVRTWLSCVPIIQCYALVV